MRHFSAQYVFTNEGKPLKRGIVSVSDDGTITGISDTGGSLEEERAVEFYNGIIIPGFVNCHCHLELSHMTGVIPRRTGLARFLQFFRESRYSSPDTITESATAADAVMYSQGTVLCADICNTNHTFSIKVKSKIKYINLLEVFGIDPSKAREKIAGVKQLALEAEKAGLPYSITPHGVYSISLELFKLLAAETASNHVTSIHFMETRAEELLLSGKGGPLMDSYIHSRIINEDEYPMLARDHVTAVLGQITRSGNLILVHNTYITKDIIDRLRERENTFWCLCPGANLYIEDHLPPLDLLSRENCKIVIGTDSHASNDSLSILDEIRTLQFHFPGVSLEELIRYATINGASALGEDQMFGSIRPGKKPGLLLLQDLDISRLKLLPGTNLRRLI